MAADRSTPLVSVVMTVRNGARFLARAIDSLLTQTLTDIEVVVVDDGSTDDTPAVLAAAAARDTRVRIFSQGPTGIPAAANRGIAEARAELIARLDADDIALPDRLEKQVAWMDAHPDVIALGGGIITIDPFDHKIGMLTYPSGARSVEAALMSCHPAACHSTVVMRKKPVIALGGYRAAFVAALDHDLWLRVVEVGEFANLPDILAYYRVHPEQVTRRRRAQQRRLAELARTLARWRREGRPDPLDQGVAIDDVMVRAGLAPTERTRPA
jgi:glycosyltransferase involved in cell wall biosynthesis